MAPVASTRDLLLRTGTRLAQSKLADLEGQSRLTDPAALAAKRAVIEAAMQRARARRPAEPPDEA